MIIVYNNSHKDAEHVLTSVPWNSVLLFNMFFGIQLLGLLSMGMGIPDTERELKEISSQWRVYHIGYIGLEWSVGSR